MEGIEDDPIICMLCMQSDYATIYHQCIEY